MYTICISIYVLYVVLVVLVVALVVYVVGRYMYGYVYV